MLQSRRTVNCVHRRTTPPNMHGLAPCRDLASRGLSGEQPRALLGVDGPRCSMELHSCESGSERSSRVAKSMRHVSLCLSLPSLHAGHVFRTDRHVLQHC